MAGTRISPWVGRAIAVAAVSAAVVSLGPVPGAWATLGLVALALSLRVGLRWWSRRVERGLLEELASELGASPERADVLRAARERREAAAQLISLRARAEEMLEYLREGVVSYVPGEGVAYANRAAREIFGLPEGSQLSLSGNARAARVEEMVRVALATGEAQESEVELNYPQVRELLVRVVPSLGGARAAILVSDVTEERKVQATRRDFVASAAHELRTPAAAIQGLAETLSGIGDGDPQAASRFRDLLRKEAARLSRLVADLLDLSRLERPDLAASFGLVDLSEVLASIWEPLENLARQNSIELHLTRAEELLPVWGEAEPIRLIAVNLIENAIRYNSSGGRVEVGIFAGNGQAVIRVADNGRGIPSKELPRIFERFYRVDRSGSRESGGTGLGLSIVKHAAELLGGSVEAESALGEGSVFTVRLPTASRKPLGTPSPARR